MQGQRKNEISRKEAIKKAGKYAVITATTALIILSPKDAPATSETGSSRPKRPTRW